MPVTDFKTQDMPKADLEVTFSMLFLTVLDASKTALALLTL
jgi:hypothetical protein